MATDANAAVALNDWTRRSVGLPPIDSTANKVIGFTDNYDDVIRSTEQPEFYDPYSLFDDTLYADDVIADPSDVSIPFAKPLPIPPSKQEPTLVDKFASFFYAPIVGKDTRKVMDNAEFAAMKSRTWITLVVVAGIAYFAFPKQVKALL